MKSQWVILLDGWPIAGTNAYTRKASIREFCGDDDEMPWEHWKDAGYKAAKIEWKLEK